MTDAKLPLIHKAPVEGLRVHVARAGLSIGDDADLVRLPEGGIGIFAMIRHPFLGLIPVRRRACIGHLPSQVEALISPSVDHGDPLRVRIVGLNPEHLAGTAPPEVHISVWGDPRHLIPRPPPYAVPLAADADAEEWDDQELAGAEAAAEDDRAHDFGAQEYAAQVYGGLEEDAPEPRRLLRRGYSVR